LRWPRTIGIYAALDLSEPLLMLVNHRNDCDHSANDDRGDWHQQTTKTEDSIHKLVHASPSTVILKTHNDLVELTGIEPVASWLQTRRSPS
jgi:hypothetical protein